MDNKVSIGVNLKTDKKINVGASFKKENKEKGQPYLLPCGNEEHCFLKIRKNNAYFCKTWKRVIWGKCIHHIETPNCKWEE